MGDRTSRRRPARRQAGILLGSNDDIPAFRWVEKERARCSSPARTRRTAPSSSGVTRGALGLLATAARAAATSSPGDADTVLLTVSRLADETRANPGYRAFLANGTNVARARSCSFGWEICLELFAATRERRGDVRPRGHRGGSYPLLRAGCACSSAT